MSGKRKEGKAVEAVRETVEVPDAFTVSGLDGIAVKEGLAILKQTGADDSGFCKIERELRPLAWREHLIGGGATADRRELDRLRLVRARIVSREAGLERKVAADPGDARARRDLGEAKGEIEATDRGIGRVEILVQAAGVAHLDDQPARMAKREATRRALDEARQRLSPYLAPGVPRLPEIREAIGKLDAGVREAEREHSRAEAAFEAGAAALGEIGATVRELTAAAQWALAAELCTVASRLGAQVLSVVKEDLAFLAANPDRLPDEVARLYREVAGVEGVAARLGRPGAAMSRFEKAVGEDVLGVLEDGLRLGRPVRESLRPKPSYGTNMEKLEKVS